MTIDAQSGLISWTPAAGQTGPQAVTVNVSDGKGGSDSQSFEITVAEAPSQNQTTVPDVTGATRSAAHATIQQAKLNFGTETFQHSDTIPDGKVISQSPIANNKVAIGTAVNTLISLGPNNNLPPNPATVAPKLDNTVVTTTYAASEFLYKGSNPIQTLGNGQPLTQGAIEPKRLAVIRGKVLDKQNIPLPGVTISILNHPELGQTLSRSDGEYDLAVNGGGALTVNLAKNGYLPSQRTQQNVPWQDYKIAEDVVLIEQDAKVTTIDLSANTMQVAQGSPVTDKDGTRQVTLLIPEGTKAKVYNPDGTTRDVSTLNLRFTEYTVGNNGPNTMPAQLPPSSAYTYAFEARVDEGNVKINGKDVLFDRPVPFYVDNFLNFPVGGIVPVGYYDKDKAVWVPSENGKVIKILAVHNDTVDIDTNGDALADDAAILNTLGITDAERGQLAKLYTAGKSLWRVQVNHLSSWDCNWPYFWPTDAAPPSNRPAIIDPKVNDPCHQTGSVIECENQVLRESLRLTGTGITLNYASDRVPGRKSNTMIIPLSGPQLSASVSGISLDISIAGRNISKLFKPQTNLSHTFSWDGLDAFDRTTIGYQTAHVRIGYEYQSDYATPNQTGTSFNRFPAGTSIRSGRDSSILYQEYTVKLAVFDARTVGLGAWTLSNHHSYDPNGKVIYLGDGSQYRANNQNDNVITRAAGNRLGGSFSGDGGPATSAGLNRPEKVVVSPDGSYFIADRFNNRIRRVGPDGIISTVAGNGSFLIGDGGPAKSAGLSGPAGIALGPDGSLYIADTAHYRVRRVGPDGIISTVAGKDQPNGQLISNGDGGLATSATLSFPIDVAVGPDGSLYIADQGQNRIRRVGLDGIITTVAGKGQSSGVSSGDGGPATEAEIAPWRITVSSDGSLYISDNSLYVRRVGADGIITTIAGNGKSLASGDGGLATSAGLSTLGTALGPDNSLYIADYTNTRIRRVSPEGIISKIAGKGDLADNTGDGGLATWAGMFPTGVAIGPDGSLFIVDSNSYVIRRVTGKFAGFQLSDINIASEDGTELYQFNSSGRHLRTLNTLTGATIYSFTYNNAGLLSAVTDGDGNTTTIDRDVIGNPTAIVAPYGQHTLFNLDINGYLAKLTNPTGESYKMAYGNEGLLTSFNDPNSHASSLIYDAEGRLVKDQNAMGGSQSLNRENLSSPRNYEQS